MRLGIPTVHGGEDVNYVKVKVRHGDNEKCHHQEAMEIANRQYPDLEILRCYYC